MTCFVLFVEQAVGLLGATSWRGRLVESALATGAALLLASAGERACAALGLPVAAAARACMAGRALAGIATW